MKPILFYDTETTGLPEWKLPSGSDKQPHIVQLASILADQESREIISTLDLIIKPEGWIIPDEASEIHGITTEKAEEIGVPEKEAIQQFLKMWSGCDRVAHNKTFDQRLIRIGLKRFFPEDEILMNKWAEKENHFCTMQMSKPIMKMPPKGRFGYKAPKMEEAYRHFTGEELEGAHSAMADAVACMKVYWSIKDIEQSIKAS